MVIKKRQQENAYLLIWRAQPRQKLDENTENFLHFSQIQTQDTVR